MKKRLMLATAAAMMASALVAPAALAADNGQTAQSGCYQSTAPNGTGSTTGVPNSGNIGEWTVTFLEVSDPGKFGFGTGQSAAYQGCGG